MGELELGTAQFDLAYQTLFEIFHPTRLRNEKQRNSDISQWAPYDEIRWDFAQAAMCAGHGSQSERYKYRDEYLKTIREHEKTREDNRFGGMLDISEMKADCNEFKLGAKLARRPALKCEILFPNS